MSKKLWFNDSYTPSNEISRESSLIESSREVKHANAEPDSTSAELECISEASHVGIVQEFLVCSIMDTKGFPHISRARMTISLTDEKLQKREMHINIDAERTKFEEVAFNLNSFSARPIMVCVSAHGFTSGFARDYGSVFIDLVDSGVISKTTRSRYSSDGSKIWDSQDPASVNCGDASWYQLNNEDGTRSAVHVLIQIRKELRYLPRLSAKKLGFAVAAICVLLLVIVPSAVLLNRPKVCDASCRGWWRAEVQMLNTRSDFSVTNFNGRLFALGGCCQSSQVESYGSQAWKTENPMTVPRSRFGASEFNGTLWAIGGIDDNSIETFNGTLWKKVDIPFTKRGNVQAFIFGSSTLCICGKQGGFGISAPSLGTDGLFNSSIDCLSASGWHQLTTIPYERLMFAVAPYNGGLAILGGWMDGPSRLADYFDGTRWTKLADLTFPRFGLGAAQFGDRLFAVGGTDGYNTLSAVESFDGVSWRPEVAMLQPRRYFALIPFDGRLFALGGSGVVGGQVTALSDVESFAFL